MVRQLTTVWQTGGQERLVKEMPPSLKDYERDKFFYIHFSDTSSAIRKMAWEQVPFRKTSFAEDALWADEVLRAGYRIVFEPASAVIHSHDYRLVEQFLQNVDYAHAMKILFDPPYYRQGMTFFRQLRAIPRNVWRDWFFIRTSTWFKSSPRRTKIRWYFYSPFWHLASNMGAYVGAHLEQFPRSLAPILSRQEKIRQS